MKKRHRPGLAAGMGAVLLATEHRALDAPAGSRASRLCSLSQTSGESRVAINQSTINQLLERVRKRKYKHYLYEMDLKHLRGFRDAEIRFDFPVTALVGANGAGKTTVLGAAALIYKAVQPRRFFARSGSYDASMSGWSVEYSVLTNGTLVSRRASYSDRSEDLRRSKWNRKAVTRSIAIIGITRTLPFAERTEGYKFAGGTFVGKAEESFEAEVSKAVGRILGKEASDYIEVRADKQGKYSILARKPTASTEPAYSEFHFGAGEASIIRIVAEIEAAEDNALILVEEVENGLHPVATKQLIEYFIDVARRKGCQILFSTHSNAALEPLPGDAIWSAYRGQLSQGKLDIESLRALTGEINARLAVFTEDRFASLMAEITLRRYGDLSPRKLDLKGIEIHALGGSATVRDEAVHNNINNPSRRHPAIALLDGDHRRLNDFNPASTPRLNDEDARPFVTFLPGDKGPEETIFGAIREELSSNGRLIGKLTLALQLDTHWQANVETAIRDAERDNRDPHNLFGEVGETLDYLSADVVARAFISTWANFHEDDVRSIWDPVQHLLPWMDDRA